jgi:hypothetical protein
MSKQWKLCKEEEAAFQNDQARGYKNTRSHNRRGELIIDLSPIKGLVRDDVKDGKHKGLTPSEFQATRPEYSKVDKKKFKERLYHEIKRKKIIFHWELERQNKGRKTPATYEEVK